MTELSGVTITYTFDAPREKVFEAWTNPQQFAQWWGPKGFTAPLDKISMDVRPGGEWRAPIVSEDGSMEIPFAGTYKVVDGPERLAFTVTDPAEDQESADVTTLVLTDLGGQTELAFNQPGEMTEEGVAELTEGWGQFFDKLNEYVTKA
ncbi:SRPBCC family protein [Actinophytocola algeriensis]|jgi:uncharacterized protein YndB with AHSA1/START domain|uniref:Uncharacterized protein YndB with AHSA1/START domain n=1 Tax=Actinophytocola algeriensis TaxID=1768010 RepID=A0A7W7QA03_9PSEU|nr:SRPBCC domain-containing protein [Actinophytocola algeriensis]MBB4909356.1 uncharacterized protein YndB with AHSA1/START domain [Actinophytocola algeriensis]MBE1475346.1 uncharacterized protein YndB with AHSA1/START domain [Actinophytocola algeriensis]